MPDDTSAAHEINGSRKPKVSIIIPCFNCRKFVAESLESCLAQSYPNVEIVVVDDGSTDGSSEVVQSYPVKFVQRTHQGVSAARNVGIQACTGEYIVFLDSDDRLFPNAVAAGMAALEQNPQCAMAVGAHNLITPTGELITTRRKPLELRDGYGLLLRSNFIECTSCVLFRRSCFSDEAGFRTNLKGAEDYESYLRIAREAPICCHNQVVTEYRLHSASAANKSKIMLTHTLVVISEQWPHARKSLRRVMAYCYGYLFWRRKYGRQLTMEMATSDVGLPPEEYKAALRLLARSYPPGILVLLISRMLPKNLVRSILQRQKEVPPAKVTQVFRALNNVDERQ